MEGKGSYGTAPWDSTSSICSFKSFLPLCFFVQRTKRRFRRLRHPAQSIPTMIGLFWIRYPKRKELESLQQHVSSIFRRTIVRSAGGSSRLSASLRRLAAARHKTRDLDQPPLCAPPLATPNSTCSSLLCCPDNGHYSKKRTTRLNP